MNSSFRLWLRSVELVLFFSFSRVKVFVPALLIGSGRLSVTSTRSVRMGSGFSSPSVKEPALALIRTLTALTPSGTWTSHATAALAPGPAVNGTVLFFSPKRSFNAALVKGSKRSSVAMPVTAAPSITATFEVNVIASPSRRKRGKFGVTIKGFCVITSLVNCAVLRSVVWVSPISFHRVSASGMVNRRITLPSLSVSRSGRKKAVSRKSVRVAGGGASATGGGGDDVPSSLAMSGSSSCTVWASVDLAMAPVTVSSFLSMSEITPALRDAVRFLYP